MGAATLAATVIAQPARAAPGDLDPTFGSGGVATLSYDPDGFSGGKLAIQPNGRILVAGNVGQLWGKGLVTARLRPNGKLDGSFRGGMVITNRTSFSRSDGVALAPDGKIVVIGHVSGDLFVIRYNRDGTVDQTFGDGGRVSTTFPGAFNPGDLFVQPDGKIVVAGTVGAVFGVVRYTSLGTLDPTFGACVDSPSPVCTRRTGMVISTFGEEYHRAFDTALQADGKIVVVGSYGGSERVNFAVARYNPNGTLDDGFGQEGLVRTDVGGGLYDAACCVAIDSQQRILVAGNRATTLRRETEAPDVFAVARYLGDGSLDPSFGTQGITSTEVGSGVDLMATDLAVGAGDGFVLAGGTNSSFAVVRYDSSGAIRPGFGNNGRVLTSNADNVGASSVAIQGDGKIVVAGGDGHIIVVRYLAS